MKNCNTTEPQSTQRSPITGCLIALGVALTFAVPQAAHAQNVTPPSVPAGLEVPPPNVAFLVGHAIGTQNYECQPSPRLGRVAWTLITPQATLFGDQEDQLITHFFSPTPEDQIVRATWQDSRDTSTVWARRDRCRRRPERVGCDCLGQAANCWNRSRTDRGHHAFEDDVCPTGEYRRRVGTGNGL